MDKENDKWLDELISHTINTEKPEFDAEKWKQKFPDEFQALLSRATDKSVRSSKRPILLKRSALKFAAAAVIILTIGLFIILPGPEKKDYNIDSTDFSTSPTDMLTMKSLTIAFNKGGIEEIENQFQKALKIVGPQSKNISIEELFEDQKS